MKTIKRGCTGYEVKVLQRMLNQYMNKDAYVGLIDDGVFGRLTDELVRSFQKSAGLKPVDGIVGPKTWAALQACLTEPVSSQRKKSRRKITEIIVHCTASIEGQTQTVEQLRYMHTLPKKYGGCGWSDIGYHYVVYLDGTVHDGRDVDKSGAHVSGRNAHSIGVAYVGGVAEGADGKLKGKDTRTPEQKEGLVKLLKELRALYPDAKILGHRDCSPDIDGDGVIEPWEWLKECPCFDAIAEYKNI